MAKLDQWQEYRHRKELNVLALKMVFLESINPIEHPFCPATFLGVHLTKQSSLQQDILELSERAQGARVERSGEAISLGVAWGGVEWSGASFLWNQSPSTAFTPNLGRACLQKKNTEPSG
jgi:hypothetical protein